MKRYLAATISRGRWSVQAIRERIVYPKRCLFCITGLAIALLGNNGAAAAEDADAGSIVCAKREMMIMMLVEAHGAFPNAASDILSAESMALMLARSACENGHVRDSIVFYDRLDREAYDVIDTERTAAPERLGRRNA
jgi:hypothetical protein